MTYDDYKLASPPEYEQRDTCPSCGAQEEFKGDYCTKCEWTADDDEQDEPIGEDE